MYSKPSGPPPSLCLPPASVSLCVVYLFVWLDPVFPKVNQVVMTQLFLTLRDLVCMWLSSERGISLVLSKNINPQVCVSVSTLVALWRVCVTDEDAFVFLFCASLLCFVMSISDMVILYSQVCEENGWVGTMWLDVLHGVPLIDTELVGWDSALVVADPGQEQAAWIVVMTTSHLTCFVERLKGRPEAHGDKKNKTGLSFEVVSKEKWQKKTCRQTTWRNLNSLLLCIDMSE